MLFNELFALAMLASSGLTLSDKTSSNSTSEVHATPNSSSSYIESVDIQVSVEEAEDEHVPMWDNSEAVKLEALEKEVARSFQALKSYISWTSFDASGFYYAATTIGIDIPIITGDIDTVRRHRDIRAKYQFLVQMFERMVEAAQFIKESASSRSPASLLVRNVIELNVRLMVLYDAFGVPDYQSRGYAYKVTRLKRSLKELRVEFARLKNKSDALSRRFMVHVALAEDSLKHLQNHISLQWFTS